MIVRGRFTTSVGDAPWSLLECVVDRDQKVNGRLRTQSERICSPKLAKYLPIYLLSEMP